jgi:cellulose synthase (UDP-forming)
MKESQANNRVNNSYHLSEANRDGMPWSTTFISPDLDRKLEGFIEKSFWDKTWMAWLMAALSILPTIVIVTTPLDLGWQTAFGFGTFLMALWLDRIKGRMVSHILILLSLLISTRYLYWRVTESILSGQMSWVDMFFAFGLVAAELYAYLVLFLGYFQVLWPLNRKPHPLPRDTSLWPTVDIFVPTYNEPLKVVRPTVLAALDIDWPKEKINVYVLDDGRRKEFKEFCDEIGATHITRNDSKHAKAGNINRALQKTKGDLVAIFDCDHIPTRSFLQITVGWFLKEAKLAMLQTPHHFFSPDPFERNLHTFRSVPNEGELFYGLLQDGNDFWNATFFCGSCAVLRRTAILEVGGVAVETVTEDAHTALKMHSKGWTTAYINIAQAAGLATESLSAHVGQRIRWARGMAQIFRIDNPFLKEGLNIGQRLCYANAMLHFFYGLPRLVFLTAPLSYLFFEAHIINASALLIAAYALPHLAHANLTNSRLQGQYRHSFWAEVYETVLSTYIMGPTLLALINPKLGTFNVTAKGGMVQEEYFDGYIAKPYIILFLVNLLGFGVGILRFFIFNRHEVDTVLLNLLWSTYNLVIVGAALSVAWESKQVRRFIRVTTELRSKLRVPDGEELDVTTIDVSEGGVGINIPSKMVLPKGAEVEIAIATDFRTIWTPAKVIRCQEKTLALEFLPMTTMQERQMLYAIFGRADAWVRWGANRSQDRIGESFRQVMEVGLSGTTRVFKLFMQSVRNKMFLFLRKTLPRQLAEKIAPVLVFLLVLGSSAPVFSAPEDPTLALPVPATAYPAAYPTGAPVAISPSMATLTPVVPGAIPDAAGEKTTRAESRTLTFQALGIQKPIRLRGVQGEIAIPVAVRDDEIVTRARLSLKFSHSPSLIFPHSHINVLVNNELAATIPLSAESAVGSERMIEIDPKLFTEYNQIGLQMIAHYTLDCEDPVHTTLWSIISNKSSLELDTAPLAMKKELNMLPQPFFDPRDSRRLTLPFVFASKPSLEELRAAGVLASWFGSLASYRGARFPVFIDKVPSGHAVVFVNGNRTPNGLTVPGEGRAARVMIGENPRSPDSELLYIVGNNGEELFNAARMVALETKAFTGSEVKIASFTAPKPRKPYDAPRWISTDRPVKLGELTQAYELEASGLYPDLIKVGFHAPPDLFTWHGKGMKLNIKYRYTPTVGSKSTLNVNINNEFVQAIALSYTNEEKAAEKRINIPFTTGYESINEATVYVPEYKFNSDNTLQFQYYFERQRGGACKDVVLDNLRGAIDQDSTIDLTSFPHYAYLPDLSLFSTGGFPFTRMADLSDTAVVLPNNISSEEIEAFLTLMGRIGNSTGYPATSYALVQSAQAKTIKDKDMLIIGSADDDQPLLQEWAETMPMTFENGQAKLKVVGPFERLRARWLGRDLGGAYEHAGQVALQAQNNRSLGAIMSFRVPGSDKTAVFVAALERRRLVDMANIFTEAGKGQFIRGDLVLFNGDQLNHYLLHEQYSVGKLPLIMGLRLWFSNQPTILIFLCLFVAFLVALVMYRLLRRGAAERKEGAAH